MIDGYRQAFDKYLEGAGKDQEKVRMRAISQLERAAETFGRRRDLASATIAWREVLRIDLEHSSSRAYFETLGTLQDTLDEVIQSPRVIEKDFTGAVMGAAKEWPATVLKPLIAYQEDMDELKTEITEQEVELRERFGSQFERLKSRYLRSVASVASRAERSGKLPEAALSYEEMLYWDRELEYAVVFFEQIGHPCLFW